MTTPSFVIIAAKTEVCSNTARNFASVATNAKFRAVFEQTSVFAAIMTNDGVVIDANRMCLDACGYRAEDVLGKPLWETGWWRGSEESRERIRAATPLVAQGGPYREVLEYSWA